MCKWYVRQQLDNSICMYMQYGNTITSDNKVLLAKIKGTDSINNFATLQYQWIAFFQYISQHSLEFPSLLTWLLCFFHTSCLTWIIKHQAQTQWAPPNPLSRYPSVNSLPRTISKNWLKTLWMPAIKSKPPTLPPSLYVLHKILIYIFNRPLILLKRPTPLPLPRLLPVKSWTAEVIPP